MLKSKIHRVTVTDANLEYEGSVTIDETLMKEADIIPFEQVRIYNISNGNRFETYAIKGKKGSGTICLNGAAARKAHRGGPSYNCNICLYRGQRVKGVHSKTRAG